MKKAYSLRQVPKFMLVLAICGLLSACVGTVVGVVVDTAIEVVKIPFKVGGAVIDVVTPDKSNDKTKSKRSTSKRDDDESG